MSVFEIALAFFLIYNPIGNTPTILALVKNLEPARQRKVLVREALLASLIAFFFLFLGEPFLGLLKLQDYTISFTGGIILVLLALSMIFPHHATIETATTSPREPFIVPIAMPILAGGGLFSTILFYLKQQGDFIKIFSALALSGLGVVIVLFLAPALLKLLGKRGMLALEQLMGMVLLMLSTELLVNGAHLFVNSVDK